MKKTDVLKMIAAKTQEDKHSLNLYRAVRKSKRDELDVYFCPTSHIDGSQREHDPLQTRPSHIYIGTLYPDGWFHGFRLNTAICEGGRTDTYAFPGSRVFVHLPNWWHEYADKGKCFIDPEHNLYGRERWGEGGDERTCKWCGHRQVKVRWQETIDREKWEDVK